MAPGDVCHGPRCSLAWLGPVAFGHRPCYWPGGSAGSPQCIRPMGCWFFPVPWPPFVCTCVWCLGPLGSCSPMCPLGALCCVSGVLGYLAPVRPCARSVCCVACAVSWATLLLFSAVPSQCAVSRVRCPGPLCSCSPVCPLGALLCLWSLLGHFAPVHRCARSVCCVACAVSWATWLLFTGVHAWFVVLLVRCPWSLGSRCPVCLRSVVCCVCGVLGHLPPVHRCARSVRCFACAVSWATWLLFTGVPARCVVLRVRCPGPLDSCSPVCMLGPLFCLCGVLGHLAPVHWCARAVCCVACAVSWATCSCSPVRLLGVLLCLCGVFSHLAPVHRCARSVWCVACAVSWATWLLFTGLPARCVALPVRFAGPLGSCSPVCLRGVLCCARGVLGHLAPVHQCACAVCCVAFCSVLGHLAPVHRCARSVRCFACAVSWAAWLLFTSVPARCVVSLSAVSWATWLLFTGAPARCVALLVRCPGPLGFCSPVCLLGVLCCLCSVLGHLAPLHRCARSVCCLGVLSILLQAQRKTRREQRVKLETFFITRQDISRRALPPSSSSSPCTSLPTLVPITPLALQLRRQP